MGTSDFAAGTMQERVRVLKLIKSLVRNWDGKTVVYDLLRLQRAVESGDADATWMTVSWPRESKQPSGSPGYGTSAG